MLRKIATIINKSIRKVNLGKYWAIFRRYINGEEAVYGGADHRVSAQAEVMVGRGSSIEEVLREIDVTANTYYRWRNEYGGLGLDQARRLKDLEQEKARLK